MTEDRSRTPAVGTVAPVGRRAWLGCLAAALALGICPARGADVEFRPLLSDEAVVPVAGVETSPRSLTEEGSGQRTNLPASAAPLLLPPARWPASAGRVALTPPGSALDELDVLVPSPGIETAPAEMGANVPVIENYDPSCDSPAMEPLWSSGSDMARERWLRHPISVGWMAGILCGSPLVDDWVGQNQGFLGEYWFGWDVHPMWGWETRLAFASVELYDSDRAKLAQHRRDDDRGILANDPYRLRFEHRRDADRLFWDIRFLWYPYTDDRWRTYLAAGGGMGIAQFTDRLDESTDATLFTLPIAIGVKCRVDRRIVLRLECGNRFSFGGGVEPLRDLSLTAGFEIRLGGARTSYWPWNPGL